MELDNSTLGLEPQHQMFGLGGVFPLGLSEVYENTNTHFVALINQVSQRAKTKRLNPYLGWFIQKQPEYHRCYDLVRIHEQFNRLNRSRLNNFILGCHMISGTKRLLRGKTIQLR